MVSFIDISFWVSICKCRFYLHFGSYLLSPCPSTCQGDCFDLTTGNQALAGDKHLWEVEVPNLPILPAIWIVQGQYGTNCIFSSCLCYPIFPILDNDMMYWWNSLCNIPKWWIARENFVTCIASVKSRFLGTYEERWRQFDRKQLSFGWG